IGGSDARIIMGNDEPALQRLWQEKRGEAEPDDLSGNLLVQLGLATEPLIGSGTSARPARVSRTSKAGFATPGSAGGERRLMASSRAPAQSLKRNLCCPGRSQRKRRRRNICRRSSTICG